MTNNNGTCFRIFIDWAMAFTILGACAVYVILLVDSVRQVCMLAADNIYQPKSPNSVLPVINFWYIILYLQERDKIILL